jgi:hypothetical protein
VVTNAGWGVSGNAGTTLNNFLGTTDGQALQLRVNNERALRLEPGTDAPNLIGGSLSNSVMAGVQGAAIAGGGSRLFPHEVRGDYGAVGGGVANSVGGTVGVIAGGSGNLILTNASFGAISGGAGNTVQGYASFIGGGRNNRAGLGTHESVIGGGYFNTNDAYRSALLGGEKNIVRTNSDYAFLGAGLRNLVDGDASSVLGGRYNSAQGLTAVMLGGESNRLAADAAFLGGGQNNTNAGLRGVLAGGLLNRIESTAGASFIGSGYSNVMQGASSVIAGGDRNAVASGASFASIGGGLRNSVAGGFGTVPGGSDNQADGLYSFAAGNHANALHMGSFVWADFASADFASTANNQFLIRARGGMGINTNSPTAGLHVVTTSDKNVLKLHNPYGQPQIELQHKSGAQGFINLEHYINGVPNINGNPYIGLESGGNFLWCGTDGAGTEGDFRCLTLVCQTLVEISDRNRKTDIEPVTPIGILERVAALPISTWAFTNAVNSRHIGPMAQDFHAAFGLGDNDTSIGPRDANGVALAAIQGLNQKLESENQSVRSALAAKDAKVAELEQRLAALEKLIKQQTK